MQRCLIVETSQIVLRVTRAILSDFGFEVTGTGSGREGLAMYQRLSPRLVIVDASLADMPALDVLQQIEANRPGRVQLLYCTTECDGIEQQRVKAAGATDVLIKPFDRSSLAAKIAGWEQGDKVAAPQSFYTRLSRSEIVRIA